MQGPPGIKARAREGPVAAGGRASGVPGCRQGAHHALARAGAALPADPSAPGRARAATHVCAGEFWRRQLGRNRWGSALLWRFCLRPCSARGAGRVPVAGGSRRASDRLCGACASLRGGAARGALGILRGRRRWWALGEWCLATRCAGVQMAARTLISAHGRQGDGGRCAGTAWPPHRRRHRERGERGTSRTPRGRQLARPGSRPGGSGAGRLWLPRRVGRPGKRPPGLGNTGFGPSQQRSPP